jgi:hypothetical protein
VLSPSFPEYPSTKRQGGAGIAHAGQHHRLAHVSGLLISGPRYVRYALPLAIRKSAGQCRCPLQPQIRHAHESDDAIGPGNFLDSVAIAELPSTSTHPTGPPLLSNLPERSIEFDFRFSCCCAHSLTRIVHHVLTHHISTLPEHPGRVL